jgi:hypothetical protein
MNFGLEGGNDQIAVARPIPTMGKVPIITQRTMLLYVDLMSRNPCPLALKSICAPKIEQAPMPWEVECCKFGGDSFRNFVALWPCRCAYYGMNIVRLGVKTCVHSIDNTLHDVPHRAKASGVNHGDRSGYGIKHDQGYTIRNADANRQPGFRRYDCVTIRRRIRGIETAPARILLRDCYGFGSVDLPHAHKFRWIKRE